MLFVSLVDCWRSQKNSSLILQLYFQAQIKPCTHHWPPSEKSSSNWLIHSYSAIHGISTSMFASKCCIRLAPASQPGSFSPPSFRWAIIECFYLSSFFASHHSDSISLYRQDKFLAPDPSAALIGLLHEWWVEWNGFVTPSPPANHVNLFLSQDVCDETTVLPPNMKWQRMLFWVCGSKMVHPHLRGRACLTGYRWPCLLPFKLVFARSFRLGFWWQIERKFLCVCLFGSCRLSIKD